MVEFALTFDVLEKQLLGIINQPDAQHETGVLIIVGGPQYRVGSHRQFVQLSRSLAANGITSMRFDCCGMGDSQGEKKEFSAIGDDIEAACDNFVTACGVKRIVLWGLCDAASAAMIHAYKDSRISGLILLNPWLRDEQSMGKAMLKYYYLQRLMSKAFWLKLLGGRVSIKSSVDDAKGFAAQSLQISQIEQGTYQGRMRDGLEQFKGAVCLILSGIDLTAKEFEEQAFSDKRWQRLFKNTQVHRIEMADHTFSTRKYKYQVERISSEFVLSL